MSEVPLKRWFYEQAEREGVSESAVRMKYYRGHYPKLKTRRIGKQQVLVKVPNSSDSILPLPQRVAS